MKTRRYSFMCKTCGYSVKQLYNCTLSFEDVSVTIMLCGRCMRRFGLLKAKQKDY